MGFQLFTNSSGQSKDTLVSFDLTCTHRRGDAQILVRQHNTLDQPFLNHGFDSLIVEVAKPVVELLKLKHRGLGDGV